MFCNTKKFREIYIKIFLLQLLHLLSEAGSYANKIATNASGIASTTVATAAASKLVLVPHRYSSSNNITILHEVPIAEAIRDDREKPLMLNTHEVLPPKPLKKKPYTLLAKSIISEYEKPRPIKEYDLHPVTFDFNLGDLEDLEHESIKKGDLSAEEKHLLRSGGELAYTEEEPDAALEVSIDIPGLNTPTTTPNMDTIITSTAATSTVNTMNVTGSTAHPSNLAEALPTVVTVSPHIFKIFKNKSSKRGRELLKKDELQKSMGGSNHNSISLFFGSESPTDEAGSTVSEPLQANNHFQTITNLYDHFYWQSSDISSKVTTGCGLEMQAYLTALHGNYEWAQKAYDASGRYRGQLLFGNDKWLGQKNFCYELNRQLQPEERKHFEFQFFVAIIAIRAWLPHETDLMLHLGECLPKSCSAADVHALLALDPNARTFSALTTYESTNATSSENSTALQVQFVRTVPGNFSNWRDLKFQLFVSFLFTLILVVIIATWYQAKLHQQQFSAAPIPAISSKVDAAAQRHAKNTYNGKTYELYQMRTFSDNNNVVEIEADVNGNKAASSLQRADSSSVEVTSVTRPALGVAAAEVERGSAQMADYKSETSSSAGAAGTYEAKQQLSLNEQILICFAFQTNADTIFNVDEVKQSQTSCVHGLRVFSVLWTIMVHTYLQMFAIAENRFLRVIAERSVWYQFIGNATFSVDTFFFISGFLVTLLFLKQEKKYPEDTTQFVRRGFLDTALFLIYRYMRLTPAYLFVILFNDFSLRPIFDASVFRPNVVEVDTCSHYWWRNILYINNFYPLNEICMIWSWYMSNDMQFYIMALLLLVLSTRHFKTAAIIVVAILLSSWGVSGVISLQYQYTHKVANPFESFDFLYDKPWQRVGTYIMGMLAGYIFYKVKAPPAVSARVNNFLWAASVGLLALVIFGVWQGELSLLSTAFYVSVGHTAFGLGLMWILLSCCWGLAPTINRVLSYRCLWPLSRLTYCTYLIHPVIMLLTSFRMSGTVHLNNLFVLTIFLGNAVVSFGAAFFISVLFEAPVIRLLKVFFKK